MFHSSYYVKSLDFKPSLSVKKLFSRYAKLYHKLVCPELTLRQSQHKFIHEVGFFSWNDYINGGFDDFQRLKMLTDWVNEFRLIHNYNLQKNIDSSKVDFSPRSTFDLNSSSLSIDDLRQKIDIGSLANEY